MSVRVIRGPGQGAPINVTLPADPAATFSYGLPVRISSATSTVVPANGDVILGVALGPSYGNPKVVDVELFLDSVMEVTEHAASANAFQPGSIIWLRGDVPGRPPYTPGANSSYYLVLRTSVQQSANKTDLPLLSYAVIPFGLKHGWFEMIA